MPLVQKQGYTLSEARDLVASASPNEDAWALLLEALREPSGQLFTAVIFSNIDGSAWAILDYAWRSRQDFQYKIETSRGRLRVRGLIEPVVIEGEIRIDREWLDGLLATRPSKGGPASNVPSADAAQDVDRNSELQKFAVELRNKHPDWTKTTIAKHIFDTRDYLKIRGQGALSADAIEREVRLPRIKRGITRRTP